MAEKTVAMLAGEIGYVFQNPDDQIFNQTVWDEIAYMPKYYKLSEAEVKKRVEESARMLEIEEFCNVILLRFLIQPASS